jgi:hypothetical protein
VLRASDADREVALALLREASVDGRLTLEELAERAELVQAARTRDEVAAATADLAPAAPDPPQEAVRHRALFSHFAREGPWRPARQSRFSAVFGSIRIDLRKAVLPGPEMDIEAKAVFGSVEVIVPEGVIVDVSGVGALSSQELRVQGAAPDGAPVIRIRHRGICGSLNVRSRPTLSDQLMEGARRWAERLSPPKE